jgi:CheY-like chemotaxis protein
MASHEILYRARVVRRFADVPPVLADAMSLGQVFINLLLNAAQSINEGDATNNEVRVATMTDCDGNALVEITDTGCGIHSAALPRVFDPFFTVKSPGGTGLGLSISHGTVKKLGGEITVTSTPGVGSTFRVVLPPCLALQGPPTPAHEATAERKARTRVLVIDDEELIREAIRRALGKECSVTLAASGREALGLLSDEAGGYDVILCDLLMPDVSGMDLYAETIRAAPALGGRFVFMTGGAFTPKARSFLENVGNPHLEKPIALAKLREIVRSARSAAR